MIAFSVSRRFILRRHSREGFTSMQFIPMLNRWHRLIRTEVRLNGFFGLLVLPDLFELLLFLCTEVIILNALFKYQRTTLEALVVDEVAFRNSIFQLIGIVRNALFHLKRFVGAAVHLISWCGGQSHKQTVEIVEDG